MAGVASFDVALRRSKSEAVQGYSRRDDDGTRSTRLTERRPPVKPITNNLKVSPVDDLNLDELTVKELRELKIDIEMAVRTTIRDRSKPKLVSSNPAMLSPVKPIDLEREARAWLAARRK